MSDILNLIRTEFRYWRASLPVGLLLLCAVLSFVLVRWPELADPDAWLPPAIFALAAQLPPLAWLISVGVVAALLGAWWCNIAATAVLISGRYVLSRAPFTKDLENWGAVWLHFSGYLMPRSSALELRRRMSSTQDYADLVPVDRAGAFSNFFREVTVGSSETTLHDAVPSGVGLRIYTDLRLSAGLLIPLPVALWFFPTLVEVATPGLSGYLHVASVVSFVVLLVECSQRSRRLLRWALADLMTDEKLAQLARGAVDTGRTRAERRHAEERAT